MIFTLGVIGAGILFIGFIYTLARGYKIAVSNYKNNTADSVLSFCIISVLAGYMAQSAVSMTEPDVMPYVVLMYGILAGIGSRTADIHKTGSIKCQ